MRHANRSSRLGVKTAHRLAMLRNMTLGLVEHGRIKTTIARAKRLRPFVEKIVTRLKDPTVANLRLAHVALGNKACVATIAGNISPKFKDRAGGYLRIMRLATPRAGDCADMALIEWVEAGLVSAYNQESSAKKKSAKVAKRVTKTKATSAKAKKADSGEADAETSGKKSAKAAKKS